MTAFVRLLERIDRRDFPRPPWREVWINVAEIEALGTLDRGDGAEVAYVRLRSGAVYHLYDHAANAWAAIESARKEGRAA